MLPVSTLSWIADKVKDFAVRGTAVSENLFYGAQREAGTVDGHDPQNWVDGHNASVPIIGYSWTTLTVNSIVSGIAFVNVVLV